jgi:hypothetical protein
LFAGWEMVEAAAEWMVTLWAAVTPSRARLRVKAEMRRVLSDIEVVLLFGALLQRTRESLVLPPRKLLDYLEFVADEKSPSWSAG